jgi:hypothetical protein
MGTQFACGAAAQCARAINRDLSCRITNDRMKLMGKPIPEAKFQAPAPQPRKDCAGPSLLELMWASLLDELAQLMPGGEYHEDERPKSSVPEELEIEIDWTEERARVQGACQGISACIALVLNPYHPNVDAVKAEAVTWWTDQEARKGMEDVRQED